jgi:hypothetical protein
MNRLSLVCSPLTPNYFIIYFGNTICYLHPLSQEHIQDTDQGLDVYLGIYFINNLVYISNVATPPAVLTSRHGTDPHL